MGKNVIVSEETLLHLLEAHASLSAWYYELWAGLRAANGTARTPDDAARAAFVERLEAEFPEIAQLARSIKVPRMYVPPPPTYMMQSAVASQLRRAADPPPSTAAPTLTSATPFSEAEAPAEAADAPQADAPQITPPPLVNPSTVKY